MATALADPARSGPGSPSGFGHGPALQQVRQRLGEWLATEFGGRGVRFAPPGAAPTGEACVSLHLMSLAPSSAPRAPQASPLEFAVRYLVTAWDEDEAAAQELLCDLAFAALEVGDWEVDFEPLPWAAWSAFGTAPRPAFVLQLPMRKPRVVHRAQRVRHPPVLTPLPMQTLVGRVQGPDEMALMEAKVTLLTLGRVARTDADGMFRFDGVPSGKPLPVRVQARGTVCDFTLDAVPPLGQPWVVDMPLSL